MAGREPHIWRVIGQNTPYMAVGMTQLGPNCVTPNTDECYPIRGEGSSLIGKIGNGQPFKVGYQYIGSPADTGTLYLRMNDCDKLLFDNAGSITVRISVRQ